MKPINNYKFKIKNCRWEMQNGKRASDNNDGWLFPIFNFEF
jgi:hypothetical protein